MIRSILIFLCLVYISSAGRPSRKGRPSFREKTASGFSTLLGRMDRNADPCTDFYEFACGRYVQETEIPGDLFWVSTYAQTELTEKRIIAALSRPISSRDIEAVRKAKLFFRSCMCVDQVESDSIQSALSYLNSTGGTWPTFDSTWTPADFDLQSSLAAASKQDAYDPSLLSLGPFIRPLVLADVTMPKPNEQVHILRPGFLLPTVSLSDTDKLEEFGQLIVDTLILLGADEATAQADGTDIAVFELLMQALPTGTGSIAIGLLNTIPQFGYINWKEYLNEVFEDEGHIFEDGDLIQFDFNYYLGLGTILSITNTRTLANDIKWRMFMQLLPAMPDSIRERYRQFEQLCTGVQSLPSRKSHCVRVVNGNNYARPTNYGMAHAVSRLFVETYMTPKMQEMNKRIGEEIKAAYKEVIEGNDWLTNQTRDFILGKIDAQTEEYIAQDWLFEDDVLNTYYRDFDIQKNTFMENHISVIQGISRRSREALAYQNQTISMLEWPTSLSEMYISFVMNMLTAGAGLLQPKGTFFDLKYPLAYNFAGSGFMIAGGTTYQVGFPGLYFDGDGVSMPPYYSLISAAKYAQRLYCVNQQYAEFDWPFLDSVKLNSALTNFYDAAVLDGIKVAYHAFEKNREMTGEEIRRDCPFDNRQLFFISYAQNFCEVMRPEIAELWSQVETRSPGKWRYGDL